MKYMARTKKKDSLEEQKKDITKITRLDEGDDAKGDEDGRKVERQRIRS